MAESRAALPFLNASVTFSKVRAILIGILGVALVGAMDAAVGYEISLLILHVIPVMFVTWFTTARWGVFFSVLVAMASALVIVYVAPETTNVFYRFLDLGSDFVATLLLVFMQSRLRASFDEALHHSRSDGLTGCWNKRGFGEQLEAEIERHRRYGHAFSLVYFDCDNFKTVNDTCGHHAGDALLAEIGRVLRAELRSLDLVGRMGGDEFAVLLRETNADAAKRAVEFMKRTLDAAMRTHSWPVTFSIGIVSYAGAPPDAASALAAADALMYEVKRQGKNGFLLRCI